MRLCENVLLAAESEMTDVRLRDIILLAAEGEVRLPLMGAIECG